jgi:cellulose synthase/poly-beta-1,6-N-acetylglucosamine synthase-like glycosyltransferase
MAEIIFIASLLLIVYVYIGYPLMAWFLSHTINKETPISNEQNPSITIIISAYNEEQVIAHTLRNKLSLEYPHALTEVIVVSDGSTDRTDIIVGEFAREGVRLIRQEPRQGKTSALNLAVAEAKGEILLFSDANSQWHPNAISMLVRNFADPEVGYVTGKMIYTNPDGSPVGDGCTAYMKYENLLREYESGFGSVIGVDGGIDAVRKSLYRPMQPDQLPDFVLPLMVIAQGHRVVYEPGAILNEETLSSQDSEFRMRVRVSLRALWAIHDMRQLLNPLKYPATSWQLFSHKVLRYLAWMPLAACFIVNPFIMLGSSFYTSIFFLQITFYSLAVVGYGMRRSTSMPIIVTAPYYFILINAAAAMSLARYLKGEKQIIWNPRCG